MFLYNIYIFKICNLCIKAVSDLEEVTAILLYSAMEEDQPEITNARIERIMKNKYVLGMVVTNPENNPLRTNLDSATTMLHVRTLRPILVLAACVVRDLDPNNELTAIRIRTRTQEYLLTNTDGYIVICAQTLTFT